MNMYKKYLLYLLLIAMSFLTACDEVFDDADDETAPLLEVSDIVFSSDYKTYDIYARQVGDVSALPIEDREMLQVREYNHNGELVAENFTAVVVGSENIGAKIIDSLGIKLLVLVDLTLPQNLVDSQLLYVRQIHRLYNSDNLYISFLHSDSVTESYLVSDYIFEHLFVSESDTLSETKRLYRAVYEKVTEMYDSTTLLGSSAKSVMVVFSDGNVYDMDAVPIDPDHYILQSNILCFVPFHDGRPIYYFNIDNGAQGAVNDAENFMKLLTDRSLGYYSNNFEWNRCEQDMLVHFDVPFYDYCIHLENPDDRLLDGMTNLQIFIDAGDTTVNVIDTHFSIGSICKPVVVNGRSQLQIILQGLLVALLLIIVIYVACQFVVPYISYHIFRYKHVTIYHGPNTTTQAGNMVADTCYYCKAPFRVGDTVVGCCSHTMHESCWHENDYHCPEYGNKCETGSHYYNAGNLFDARNAHYLLSWFIISVVIALLAWMDFILYDQEISFNYIVKLAADIKGVDSGSSEMEAVTLDFASHLDQFPSFGAFIGFVFTFFISLMICPYYTMLRRLQDILIRSVVAGVGGYIFFLLGFLVSVVFDIPSASSIYIDWIPWTCTAFLSVMASTYRTSHRPRHKWLIVLPTVGVLSMFLWDLLFASRSSDYRLILFISNLIFVLGVTLSIARPGVRSHHYVLNISGCVKQMDVALYKYFARSPNTHVTIGKSIDCSIQTSWDIKGNVAAIHAEIVQAKGRLCLVPLEEGVYFRNKLLKVGRRYELYHGRSFIIGTTTFTFHERDLH